MATIGDITGKLTLDSSNFVRGLKKTETNTKRMRKQFDITSAATSRLGAAMVSLAAVLSVRELSRYADTWKLVEGRLSLVTKGTEDLLKVQNDLFVMAQRTRGAFEDTANLYARIARSTKELAFEQRDMLAVTEAINKSIIVSGSSTESANAAIMQLGQGFASGTLRGEELNSVLEQTPRLAEAIAAGMDKTVGQLRSMGAAGELTAEAVFNAILKQKDVIDKEFGKMPITIGQSLTVLNNEILRFVGEADKATGASTAIAEGIIGIGNAISATSSAIKDGILSVQSAVQIKEIEDYFRKMEMLGEKWLEANESAKDSWFFKDAYIQEQKLIEGEIALLTRRFALISKTNAIDKDITPPREPELTIGKEGQAALDKYNLSLIKQRLNIEATLESLKLQNQMVINNVGGIEYLNELRRLGVGLETETGRQLVEQMALRDQLKEVGIDETERERLAERLVMIQESFLSEQELLSLHIAQKRALIDESFAQDLIDEAERKILFENLEREHQIKLSDINNTGVAHRLKFEKMSAKDRTKTVLNEMQTLTAGVANSNKSLFAINKVAALAQAAIAFPSGIMKTMEAFPYPINIGMAGLHGAAMLQQISNIKSASFGGGGSTTTPSGGGGTVTTPGIAPSDIPGPIAEEAAPTKEVTINLGDRAIISTDAVRELIEEIQKEAGDMGLKIAVAS